LGLVGATDLLQRKGLTYGGDAAALELAGWAGVVQAIAIEVSAELAKRLHPCREWPSVCEEVVARLDLQATRFAELGGPLQTEAAAAFAAARAAAARHGLRNADIALTVDDAELGLRLSGATGGAAPSAIVTCLETADGETAPALSAHTAAAIRHHGGDAYMAERWLFGRRHLAEAPGGDHAVLRALGFTDVELAAVEAGLTEAHTLAEGFAGLDSGFL